MEKDVVKKYRKYIVYVIDVRGGMISELDIF